MMECNVQMAFPHADVRVDYTPLHAILPDARMEVLGVDEQTSAAVRDMASRHFLGATIPCPQKMS